MRGNGITYNSGTSRRETSRVEDRAIARQPMQLDTVENDIIIDALSVYRQVLPDGHALQKQIEALQIRFGGGHGTGPEAHG